MSSISVNNKTQWSYEKKHEQIIEIDNFSRWIKGKIKIKTPAFRIGQTKWMIRVVSDVNIFSIELVLLTNMESMSYIACVLSIINSHNEKKGCQEIQKRFLKTGDNAMMYFGTKFLKDDEKTLIPNDRLTLHVTIEYFVLSSTEHVILVPESRLIDDLNGLLRSNESADVILKCKGEQFKAHKMILACRSPVFTAMFKHEMKEKNSCTVDIADMEEDVLRAMLQYLYTDTVNDLEKLAPGLLVAADKYDLKRLRIMCQHSMATQLSVDNAVDTLLVAETHSAEQLRKHSIQFIKSHLPDIVKTAAWKRMIVGKYADLIAELIA